MKTRHDCVDCDFMKSLENRIGQVISFCMFDLSPSYLGAVGEYSGCELDGFVEEVYEHANQ